MWKTKSVVGYDKSLMRELRVIHIFNFSHLIFVSRPISFVYTKFSHAPCATGNEPYLKSLNGKTIPCIC